MCEKKDGVACCFTGHRSIPPEKYERLREILGVAVSELYDRGYRAFLSGGALGFDLLAAEVVLELQRVYPDVRLIMALPCRNQHEKWGAVHRIRYEKILDRADERIFLCETYCTGCMHLRNKYLVDNSDVCIAFYRHRGGGTEYTVNYAREKEREIINLGYMV